MLIEHTLFGKVDKVKMAIDRLQSFEPPEGYYLAFSGGKDSQAIYHLAKEAKVKFDAHYNLTTVDPPELVHFIKKNYPDVHVHRPELTMWQLIVKKLMPPTRLARYCCEYFKEGGGKGRIVVTGVRWAESANRKNNRGLVDLNSGAKKNKRQKIMLNNDNDEARKIIDQCAMKSKHLLNPIIDWSNDDPWEYQNSRGIEHCCLYDEGFVRLG